MEEILKIRPSETENSISFVLDTDIQNKLCQSPSNLLPPITNDPAHYPRLLLRVSSMYWY